MLHNYGQHSQIEAHVAEVLANSGFNVYAFDFRGHGESEGKKFTIDNL